jgi:hypothetical protein
MKIYPNPASGERIQVDFPSSLDKTGIYTLHLYNLFGQEVAREPYAESFTLPGLAPGIYIITLSGSSSQVVATAKLVISR